MAEPIIPAGAFAAMKAGKPIPSAPSANQPGKPESSPKTMLRKPEQKTVEQPAQPPSKPESAMSQTEKKIWKLKADGEEFEFDATDEEAVKREIMKARGADKRFKDAAQKRQEAEQILSMLKDPTSLRKVLTDPRIGVDVKKFAEDYLWEQIQEQKMTPEQKAQRDRDRELEELRAERDRENQTKAEREKAAKVAQFENHYEEKIMKALEVGGIPKTHGSVARMANYLMNSLERGIDLTPEQLVQEVRKDYLGDINSLLSSADEDTLFQLLGEANAAKLRKADLKRLKSPQGNPFPDRKKPKAKNTNPERSKKIPGSLWKENMVKDFLARKR